MLCQEVYGKHASGETLIRTYSDQNMYIRQQPSGYLYGEAVDLESHLLLYTYEETDIPIEPDPEPDWVSEGVVEENV